MSLSGASNVARSSIQLKNQNNKRSSEGEVGGDWEGGMDKTRKRGGEVGNIGGSEPPANYDNG